MLVGPINCCNPFLINITAIAARSRLIILDSAFEPASPKNFINNEDNENINPAKRIFVITDIIVGKSPYCETMTREVVKTAGPTISGVPSGTAPRSFPGIRLLFT